MQIEKTMAATLAMDAVYHFEEKKELEAVQKLANEFNHWETVILDTNKAIDHGEVCAAAGRFDRVVMFAQEFQQLGRHDRLFERDDVWYMDRDFMPDEIVERRKLQPPDVSGPHEEDPSLQLQRFVRKGADPLSL